MDKLKSTTVMALLFCLLVFSLTVMDFLALHDIRKDYLSKEMVEQFELTTSKEIPAWTATPGEWLAVNISLVVRIFFLIFIVIVLISFLRNMKVAKS